jgi:hypothetical protein
MTFERRLDSVSKIEWWSPIAEACCWKGLSIGNILYYYSGRQVSRSEAAANSRSGPNSSSNDPSAHQTAKCDSRSRLLQLLRNSALEVLYISHGTFPTTAPTSFSIFVGTTKQADAFCASARSRRRQRRLLHAGHGDIRRLRARREPVTLAYLCLPALR